MRLKISRVKTARPRSNMVDLSVIGKDGFIIQYEEIITLTGCNVLHGLRNKIDTLRGMSDEDILRGYFNRQIEDPSEYLKKEYNIDFPIDKMYASYKTMTPNMLYAYMIFDKAHENGIRNLAVYSLYRSEAIEKHIKRTFPDFKVDYVHGDIKEVMENRQNWTLVTSNTKVVRDCANVGQAFALMIIDDFTYTAPLFDETFLDSLRKKGIFVGFTGALSAGVLLSD